MTSSKPLYVYLQRPDTGDWGKLLQREADDLDALLSRIRGTFD